MDHHHGIQGYGERNMHKALWELRRRVPTTDSGDKRRLCGGGNIPNAERPQPWARAFNMHAPHREETELRTRVKVLDLTSHCQDVFGWLCLGEFQKLALSSLKKN